MSSHHFVTLHYNLTLVMYQDNHPPGIAFVNVSKILQQPSQSMDLNALVPWH